MNQPDKMTLGGTLQKRQSEQESKAVRRSLAQAFSIPARFSLLLALILAPWAFGSVQYWAQLGLGIALLIGLAFWWFETAMNTGKRQVVPYISLLVLGGLVIGAIQLVALPDSIAERILSVQLEIYRDFFGASSKASITLDREGTWGQIRLLVMALAGMLLGARYFRTSRDATLLLGVCAVNGVLLSFVGIVQKLNFNGKLLWLVEFGIGIPFGPYVNRNNAAGFLLMCFACCLGLIPIVMANRKRKGPEQLVSREMPIWRQLHFYVLYFISELTAKKLTVLVFAILIACGILASLSRGGVTALLVGCIVTMLLYGLARRPKNFGLVLFPVVFFVFVLSGWIGFSGPLMKRFSRIDMVEFSNDGRIQHWIDTYPAIADMGVLGSGLGSYRGVHRSYRSDVETTLFEFAENQYFQSAVEAGWPGFTVFVLAWLMGLAYATSLLYRGKSGLSIGMGTFGVFLISSQSVAAFFDFGLYIPSNMLLMSVLIGFLGYHAHALAGRLRNKTWLRFSVPNSIVQVMLLFVFAGMTIVTLDLFRRSRMEGALYPKAQSFKYLEPDMQQCELKIAFLEKELIQCPSVETLNYLGELWIHRARIQFMESMMQEDQFQNAASVLEEDEQAALKKNLWSMTTLQRMQENYYYLKNDISVYRAQQFTRSSYLQDNLPFAYNYFKFSKQRSPLQPTVHLRLGQLAAALGKSDVGAKDIERAIRLAPNNPDYRMLAGIFYLQYGDLEDAAKHFQKYLVLFPRERVPREFDKVMKLLKGRSGRRIKVVEDNQLRDFLPDDPELLYLLAKKWLKNETDRENTLNEANAMIGKPMPTLRELILLRSNIRLALNDPEGAIEALNAAYVNNPMDEKTINSLANLHFAQGQFEQALEYATKLTGMSKKADYTRLKEKIEEAKRNREQMDENSLID